MKINLFKFNKHIDQQVYGIPAKIYEHYWQFSVGFHKAWNFQGYSTWIDLAIIGWYFGLSTKRITILGIDFTLERQSKLYEV